MILSLAIVVSFDAKTGRGIARFGTQPVEIKRERGRTFRRGSRFPGLRATGKRIAKDPKKDDAIYFVPEPKKTQNGLISAAIWGMADDW